MDYETISNEEKPDKEAIVSYHAVTIRKMMRHLISFSSKGSFCIRIFLYYI